jgi:hypothetical protein
MSNTCYSCQILMKLEFYRQIFEKYSNIKFHENTSSGSRTVPRGGTDRHDEAKTCFRNFANAPKTASLFSTVFTPGSQGRSHMQSNRKLCTAFLRLRVEMSIFRQFTESKALELPQSAPKEKLSTTNNSTDFISLINIMQ